MWEQFAPSFNADSLSALRSRLLTFAPSHPAPELESLCRSDSLDGALKSLLDLPRPARHVRASYDDDGVRRALHAVQIVNPGRPAGGPTVVLLHGWPGSFMELLPLGLSLSCREVLIPSLPGFAWSDALGEGCGSRARVARVLSRLLSQMCGDGFVVCGGDWGGIVAGEVARLGAGCVGLHLNIVAVPPLGFVSWVRCLGGLCAPTWLLEQGEAKRILRAREYLLKGSAYLFAQSTCQSHAEALQDSPGGWLGYVLDKFTRWSDLQGRTATEVYGAEFLLANALLYTLTRTVRSSFQIYRDSWNDWSHWSRAAILGMGDPGGVIQVPTAVSTFPMDIISFPEASARATLRNVKSWVNHSKGGHFPARECPELLREDIERLLGSLK